MIQIPGLIDPHVHLREPGATHKEDWDSGTTAALAGGFTTVLAMPNTRPPVTDATFTGVTLQAARAKLAAIMLNSWVRGRTWMPLENLAPQTAGLKMYLDQTYGPFAWMR